MFLRTRSTMALKSLQSRASRASVSTQDPALDRILTWLQNRDNCIDYWARWGGGLTSWKMLFHCITSTFCRLWSLFYHLCPVVVPYHNKALLNHVFAQRKPKIKIGKVYDSTSCFLFQCLASVGFVSTYYIDLHSEARAPAWLDSCDLILNGHNNCWIPVANIWTATVRSGGTSFPLQLLLLVTL